MPERDPVPDGSHCQANGLPNTKNSTAVGPDGAPTRHTVPLISAWASLITALTGVAVVLLDRL